VVIGFRKFFYLQVYIKDDDQKKNKLGIGNLKKDREPENKGRAQIRKRLRSPGIDSKESIPPAYVAWRAGTSNRVAVPDRQARNRLLASALPAF
jgi:hypothetical protein